MAGHEKFQPAFAPAHRLLRGAGTEIRYPPITQTLTIKSPKNVNVGWMAARTDPGGSASITVSNYQSSNDNAVIAAVGKANVQMMQAAAKAAQAAMATAAKGAGGP